MIRKEDCANVSEEEFEKLVLPHDKKIDEYLKEISYDYVAFYLASGYELSALWEGPLRTHVNSALQVFCDPESLFNDFDYEKLEKILEEKYNLKIINFETSEIIESKNL